MVRAILDPWDVPMLTLTLTLTQIVLQNKCSKNVGQHKRQCALSLINNQCNNVPVGEV